MAHADLNGLYAPLQCTDADGANSSAASKVHEIREAVQLWRMPT